MPILTISIGAAVPFVVAAVKGVVKPWLAVAYVAVAVLLLSISTAFTSDDDGSFIGTLLIFLIVASATHTALLDNERILVGE